VRRFEIAPEQLGLERARPEDLRGGDAATNARALRAVLDGESGAYRDIVLLNAAAALLVAGKVGRLPDGARLAAEVIDNGHARHVLDRLVEITNQVPAA
jgi:anthranilate phosphoribosyltransferase